MYITRKCVFEQKHMKYLNNVIPYEDNGTSLVITEYMQAHTDISNGEQLEIFWTRYKTRALIITNEMAEKLFEYKNTSEDKSRWIFVEEV